MKLNVIQIYLIVRDLTHKFFRRPWKLDAQLQSLAAKCNCDYTRYADDITFSFTRTKKKIPRAIVGFDETGAVVTGKALERIIQENGFRVNKEKTRLQGNNERQTVTGLTVNKFTNVKRSFMRKTNSMLYSWERFGAKNAELHYVERYLEKPLLARNHRMLNRNDGDFFIDVVKGRINFIQMVRGRADPVYRKLAYRLSKVLGCENRDYLKSAEELLAKSVFIVDNNLHYSQGTAFMLSSIGLVTNEHVVDGISLENGELLEFYRDNEIETKRTSTYVFSKKSKDLAVFYGGDGFSEIPGLKVGDSSKLRIGDSVTVVGYPQYNEGDSIYVNKGKIIQKAMRFEINFWLLDIPINHGNSGGPVLNDNLEVVGIATLGSKIHDQSTKYNGFIPIENLLDEVQKSKFKNTLQYCKVLSTNPTISENQDIFIVGNENYCKKCYQDKQQMSVVVKTRDNNSYNCKYCSKVYTYKA